MSPLELAQLAPSLRPVLFTLDDSDGIAEEIVGEVIALSRDGLTMRANGRMWTGRANGVPRGYLNGLIDEGAHLCYAESFTPRARRVDLRVASFVSHRLPPRGDAYELGIPDATFDPLKRQLRRDGVYEEATEEEMLEWLERTFVLRAPVHAPCPDYLVVQPYDSDPDPLKFRVLGGLYEAQVETDETGRRLLSRVKRRRQQSSDREMEALPLALLRAPAMRFVPRTIAGAMRERSMGVNEHRYLALWQRYHEADLRRMVVLARRIGWFPYRKWEKIEGDLARFTLGPEEEDMQERWDLLMDLIEDGEGGIELIASSEPPTYLNSTEVLALTPRDLKVKGWTGRFHANRGRMNWARLQLDLQGDADALERVSQTGMLFLSLRGDGARLDRQREALRNLSERAMPGLQFFLADIDSTPPSPWPGLAAQRPLQGHVSDSPGIRAVFRGARPNPSQQEAIEVALRTPDIAIIQGPPGTGKTQVIAAIQARLAELAELGEASTQILLTGYQHDAVENLAITSANRGIVAVKVGTRQGQEETFMNHLKEARLHLIQQLQEKGVSERSRAEELAERVQLLTLIADMEREEAVRPPLSVESLHDQLEQLLEEAQDFVSADVADAFRRFSSRLAPDALERSKKAVAPLVALLDHPWANPTPVALGYLQAFLRVAPSSLVSPGERDELRDAIRADILESTHQRLIYDVRAYASSTSFALRGAYEMGLDVLRLLREEIISMAETAETATERLQRKFLQSLHDHPERFEEAVTAYATSLAATCSQAASHQIGDVRLLHADPYAFETVIVDEAARANPLDLLIPATQARARLILVGDQRQLPQMLEDDVEEETKAVEGEAHAEHSAHRQVSLFERLFDYAKGRYREDGFNRVVTLKEQYRMHPTLGAFVAESFYAVQGGEPLKSALPPEAFRHTLPGYERHCCAWIDVPRRAGGERTGRKWARDAEAMAVAREVARIMRAPEGAALTFGVISFYRAQIELIKAELEKLSVLESVGKELRVSGDCLGDFGDAPHRRFQIGTVDAFQGKEFDIVFLSCVRTSRLPADIAACRRNFGFLALPNRACVAMSRQRRLLVLTGDAGFFETEAAAIHVPAFHRFVGLCRKTDTVSSLVAHA